MRLEKSCLKIELLIPQRPLLYPQASCVTEQKCLLRCRCNNLIECTLLFRAYHFSIYTDSSFEICVS